MSSIVIDANIALKWVLNDEDFVGQANQLREVAADRVFDLAAPGLWIYEVVNGLVVATRRGRINARAVTQALDDINATGVTLVSMFADQVYERALRYNMSGYDAAYLTLAEELDAPIWTADRRFYETIRPQSMRIQWIGDFVR